jgi:hypothetical protein
MRKTAVREGGEGSRNGKLAGGSNAAIANVCAAIGSVRMTGPTLTVATAACPSIDGPACPQ